MRFDNNYTRRGIVHSAIGSAAALIGGSSVAGANSADRSREGGIYFQGGQFHLGTKPFWVEQGRYELSSVAVDRFNKAIDIELINIDQGDTVGAFSKDNSKMSVNDNVTIEEASTKIEGYDAQSFSIDHNRDENIRNSGISINGCNRSGMSTGRSYIPPEIYVTLYLSNDDIRDITAFVGGAALTGSLLLKALKSADVVIATSLPNPVLLAFLAGVAAYWTWVEIANDGCGVKIESGLSPINPLVPTPTVKGQ